MNVITSNISFKKICELSEKSAITPTLLRIISQFLHSIAYESNDWKKMIRSFLFCYTGLRSLKFVTNASHNLWLTSISYLDIILPWQASFSDPIKFWDSKSLHKYDTPPPSLIVIVCLSMSQHGRNLRRIGSMTSILTVHRGYVLT